MPEPLAFTSSLTDKYQTTVPTPVRAALGLGKRDKIRFVLRDGLVVVEKGRAENEDDPVVAAWLDFLERDLLAKPGRLAPLDAALLAEADALVAEVDVDLDAPLAPADD